MLTNIAVLRTVKENANKAVLDALPSILFEGSYNGKDAQKYYLQGPAAEYVLVNIPDETAKKFSQCATALAMQLILLSNKTKGCKRVHSSCKARYAENRRAVSCHQQILPESNYVKTGVFAKTGTALTLCFART